MTAPKLDEVERIIPEAPRKQNCSVCGAKLKPIFKCTPDPNDWFWRECDTCMEPCCDKCSDVDDNGVCECTDCYQGRKFKEITNGNAS